MAQKVKHKWGMVIDIDKCIGCQACVVACQAENNIPINNEDSFHQRRAMEWIRIERYWDVPADYRGAPGVEAKPEETPFQDVKARFIPILCQHCENAPCEPVCPVYATYHNDQGMNVQVYNRCVGTRYCANNCPYQVRYFNFWEPVWPARLRHQLNPDVTVRSRGIMEKCTFCVQKLRGAERTVEGPLTEGEREQRKGALDDEKLEQGNFMPACVQACPTNTLIFGDLEDDKSQVRQYVEIDKTTGKKKLTDPVHEEDNLIPNRAYQLLAQMGTEPNVIYLKKIDPHHEGDNGAHA